MRAYGRAGQGSFCWWRRAGQGTPQGSSQPGSSRVRGHSALGCQQARFCLKCRARSVPAAGPVFRNSIQQHGWSWACWLPNASCHHKLSGQPASLQIAPFLTLRPQILVNELGGAVLQGAHRAGGQAAQVGRAARAALAAGGCCGRGEGKARCDAAGSVAARSCKAGGAGEASWACRAVSGLQVARGESAWIATRAGAARALTHDAGHAKVANLHHLAVAYENVAAGGQRHPRRAQDRQQVEQGRAGVGEPGSGTRLQACKGTAFLPAGSKGPLRRAALTQASGRGAARCGSGGSACRGRCCRRGQEEAGGGPGRRLHAPAAIPASGASGFRYASPRPHVPAVRRTQIREQGRSKV